MFREAVSVMYCGFEKEYVKFVKCLLIFKLFFASMKYYTISSDASHPIPGIRSSSRR